MKKIVPFVLALCVVLTISPVIASSIQTEILSENYDYDYVTNLGGGLFLVGYACRHDYEDGMYGEQEAVGVIDYSGKVIVPVRFEWIERISSNLIMAKAGNIHNALDIGPTALYDINGNEIVYASYDDVPSGQYADYHYYDDKTIITATYAGTGDSKWGVINSAGSTIASFEYAKLWNYSEQHLIACLDTESYHVKASVYEVNPNDFVLKQYGILEIEGEKYYNAYFLCEIDRNGIIVERYANKNSVPDSVDWEYNNDGGVINSFETASVIEENGLYGYRSTDGTMLMPCVYLDATKFIDDYAAVKNEEGWKLIYASYGTGMPEKDPNSTDPDEQEPSEPTTPVDYEIWVSSADNGTVTVSPTAAREGAEVTVTVTPDEGYELADLTVADRFGDAVAVSANGDGTYSFVMPDSQVTISAAFQAVAEEETDEPWVNTFVDVDTDDWYYDYVEYVCANGLMVGTSDVTFEPTGTVTRGTLMTILARLDGTDTTDSDPWYQAGMEWAVAAGVSDGTDPEGTITREQVATMLWRYAGQLAVAENYLAEFDDADEIHDWAAQAMNWAVSVGVITGGDNGLDPQGTATRAELAAMLTRFCENVL